MHKPTPTEQDAPSTKAPLIPEAFFLFLNAVIAYTSLLMCPKIGTEQSA